MPEEVVSVRVVAVNGSARKRGNTSMLIETVFEPLRAAGHDCELIELAGRDIRGCIACGKCREMADNRCHGRKDDGNEIISQLFAADAIVLGSPTYFADITPELKAIIDRTGYVARGNGNPLARKPGAAVVAVRRGGAIHAFDSINHFFLIGEMVVVGSNYWNLGVGGPKGAVLEDAEGMGTMRRLGENLAWVMERFAQ
jgi:multimeric flavodoxin WrbA